MTKITISGTAKIKTRKTVDFNTGTRTHENKRRTHKMGLCKHKRQMFAL